MTSTEVLLGEVSTIIDCEHKTAPATLGETFAYSVGTKALSANFINIDSCKPVDEATYRTWSNRAEIEEGDVILAREAPVGGIGLVKSSNPKFCLGQRTVLIRPNRTIINPIYLNYLLQSSDIQRWFADMSSGSIVLHLNVGDIKKLPLVNLPSLQVQESIADVLNNIESKIECNKNLSILLEKLVETMFKSWFIDFDPLEAKMAGEKPAGMDAATAALFPDSMEESELGLIPKGWEVKQADEIFEVGIGRTPPRKEPEWFCGGDEGVPWVSIRDMGTFETYSHATNEGLTQSAVDKFRVPLVPENTVLMSFKLTVGKLCITDRDLVTNEAIAHFRIVQKSPLDSFYTYLWLSNHDMGSLDSTSSIGTATNSGVIKQIKFLVPRIELRKIFCSNIGSIFEQLKLLRHQTTNLMQIRDSLLPRLISGELQIPEDMLAS